MNTLEKNTHDFIKNSDQTVATRQAFYFLTTSNGLDSGLRDMINGLEKYVKGYKASQDVQVGDDFYLSPYLEEIARALQGLLSGIGTFDGGILSKTICDICTDAGLNIEE